MGTTSKAARNRWKDIPKEERSRRMSELVQKRWDKMTPKERSAYSRKMNKARIAKKK